MSQSERRKQKVKKKQGWIGLAFYAIAPRDKMIRGITWITIGECGAGTSILL
jgi:hypothetical protein